MLESWFPGYPPAAAATGLDVGKVDGGGDGKVREKEKEKEKEKGRDEKVCCSLLLPGV